jgi:hypothetical protein
VVCGGKVSRVVDMSDWADEDETKSWIIYVTLDDGLIVVSGPLWEDIEADVGDIVIASGILFSLSKTCQFKSQANTDITVICENEPLRLPVRSICKLPMKKDGDE